MTIAQMSLHMLINYTKQLNFSYKSSFHTSDLILSITDFMEKNRAFAYSDNVLPILQ